MIGTNDAAPKFNADLRLVGSHFLSLLHMLATLRRKHSRLHRAPIFVVLPPGNKWDVVSRVHPHLRSAINIARGVGIDVEMINVELAVSVAKDVDSNLNPQSGVGGKRWRDDLLINCYNSPN